MTLTPYPLSIPSISLIHIERFVSDARCMVRVSHERSNICPSVIVPLSLSSSSSMTSVSIVNCSHGYRSTQTIHVYVSRAKLFRGSTSFCGLYGIRPRDLVFICVARKRFTRQARFNPPWKRHPASRHSSPPHRTKRFWVYRRVYPFLAVVCCHAGVTVSG